MEVKNLLNFLKKFEAELRICKEINNSLSTYELNKAWNLLLDNVY